MMLKNIVIGCLLFHGVLLAIKDEQGPPVSQFYRIRLYPMIGEMQSVSVEACSLISRAQNQIALATTEGYLEAVHLLNSSFSHFQGSARAAHRHLRAIVLERLAALTQNEEYHQQALAEAREAYFDWISVIATGFQEDILLDTIEQLRGIVLPSSTITPALQRILQQAQERESAAAAFVHGRSPSIINPYYAQQTLGHAIESLRDAYREALTRQDREAIETVFFRIRRLRAAETARLEQQNPILRDLVMMEAVQRRFLLQEEQSARGIFIH